MRRLLHRLWADDDGVVISVELVLVLAILVFGVIPGLVAMRNSVAAALATLANLASVLTPSFTFSEVTLSGGGTGFVLIAGFNVTTTTVIGVSATPVAPNPVVVTPVSPAP